MKYPIGIQSFDQIIGDGYVYVDKTGLIYQLVKGGKIYFLSRPRRFGKSLLVSTLKCYFQGRKELFKGLAIDKLETEWAEYPVFHIDFNGTDFTRSGKLDDIIGGTVGTWEKEYGRTTEFEDIGKRFAYVLQQAHQRYGRRCVVLVDEYDKPILDVLDTGYTATIDGKERLLEDIHREILKSFYSTFKLADEDLQFVLLTGVTKFSQVSGFSGFNQPADISMAEQYETLCGITQEELEHYFAEPIEALAKKYETTFEGMKTMLKHRYDGYHFSDNLTDVYNPFSLLNAFSDGMLESYWFGSGTPTYLIEMLRKFDVQPSEIEGIEAVAEDFDAPTERMENITPLLYQSGYITIKEGYPYGGIYRLGIPNKEVRTGLMSSLLPNYVQRKSQQGRVTIVKMSVAVSEGRMDDALRLLQTFLSTVPYCNHTNYEGHYQQLLYVIFSMMSYEVDVEVRTPRGRVDVVMRTATRLYLIELKLDKSADRAVEQINLKNYAERFALCGLPVVKVGINFDSEKGTIEDWKIVD